MTVSPCCSATRKPRSRATTTPSTSPTPSSTPFWLVKAEGLAFGSGPGSPDNGKLNRWNGGRGFYFKVPDGHLFELMTEPQ